MAPCPKLVLLQVYFRSVFKTGWVLARSRSVSVVDGESVQVSQLAQAALDVRYVDLYVVLETTGVKRENTNSEKGHVNYTTVLLDV